MHQSSQKVRGLASSSKSTTTTTAAAVCGGDGGVDGVCGGVDISQPTSAILGGLSPVRKLHRKPTNTSDVPVTNTTAQQVQGLSKSTGSVVSNAAKESSTARSTSGIKLAASTRPTYTKSSRVASATTSPTRTSGKPTASTATTAARRRSTRPFVHRYHRRFVLPEDALAPTSSFATSSSTGGGQRRSETRFVSSQLTGDGLAKAERITQRDSQGRPTRLQGYIVTGNPPPQSILDDDFRLGKRWDFHGARRGQGDSGLVGMVGEGGVGGRDPLRDDDSYFEMYRGEIEEVRAQEVLEEHERNRQELIHHSPDTVLTKRPPRGGGMGSMDSLIARNVAYLDADAVGAIDDTTGELTRLTTKDGIDGGGANNTATVEPTPLSRAAVIKRTVGIHDVSFGTVQSPTARSTYVVQLAESTRRQRSPAGGGGGGGSGEGGGGAVVVPSPEGGDTGFMVPCALCNVIYSKQALKFRTTSKNIVRLHAEWKKQAADEEDARRQAAELSALMWNTTMTRSVDQSCINSSAVSHVSSPTRGGAGNGGGMYHDDDGYSLAVEEINNILMVNSPEESDANSPTSASSPTNNNNNVGKLGLHRLAGLSKRISVSFLGASPTEKDKGRGGVGVGRNSSSGGGGLKKPIPRAASVSFPGPTSSSSTSKPPLHLNQSSGSISASPSSASHHQSKDANTAAAGAAHKHNKASNMYAPVWVCTFCGQFFGLYEGMCGGPQTLEEVNTALIDECRHLKRNRVARVKQSRKENQALNSRLHKELDGIKHDLAEKEELAKRDQQQQQQLRTTASDTATNRGGVGMPPPPASPTLSVTIYGSVPDANALSVNPDEAADAFSPPSSCRVDDAKKSASEEAVLSTLGLTGVGGGVVENTPASLTTYPPLEDSSTGVGGGGVSPTTNAMGISMSMTSRTRGASMRGGEGGSSGGRFKAVVKSVFETMTMLGKSARGDLDFTRIRGGTFGMVAKSETPRAATSSAGATSSMRGSQNQHHQHDEGSNKPSKPKLLSEVQRGALVEAFYTDGAPSMRMAISEPLSPPVSPRLRGVSKAAKKWRRLSTTSRSRSQSLTSAPASQSPPADDPCSCPVPTTTTTATASRSRPCSCPVPTTTTTATASRSRSFSKGANTNNNGDVVQNNRLSRESTLVFIPPDQQQLRTMSSIPDSSVVGDDDDDGALSIASNASVRDYDEKEDDDDNHHHHNQNHPTTQNNDVSLDATNPSSFATSALDASASATMAAHSSSRKQQQYISVGSVPSPNPRDPRRSTTTTAATDANNNLNPARKLLPGTKRKKNSKYDNIQHHPQPALSFEKQCTLMRGQQQERNRMYVEQRARRLEGASSPPPPLHAPKRRSTSSTSTSTAAAAAAHHNTKRPSTTSATSSRSSAQPYGPGSILLSPINKRPASSHSRDNKTTITDYSTPPTSARRPPIVFEL